MRVWLEVWFSLGEVVFVQGQGIGSAQQARRLGGLGKGFGEHVVIWVMNSVILDFIHRIYLPRALV